MAKAEFKTKRVCAGRYEVTDGENTVTLDRRDDLNGWIASANWDRYRYTDPLPTKAAAKFNALHMLREPTQ